MFPHDLEVHEYSTGQTRRETFEDLGLRNVITIPRMKVADKYGLSEGHNAMRQLIPKCWFDAEKCDDGIEALKSYRREWDEKKESFGDSPVKDWSKHFADAFRQLASGMGIRQEEYDSHVLHDNAMFQYDELGDINANYNPLDDYTWG